ncbi:hypothetical protein LLG96_05875, partial [bacterium]|nr:hypothetical protein [bacterium]
MTAFYVVLTVVLIGGCVIYSAACLLALSGHCRHEKTIENNSPTVSIIIAARNEVKHIGQLLDDLTGQDYPADRFEI